ncbi:HAMP domain-containing sensor histidine kinase [Pseudogulbenkiania ferrooxidans]|uniref:histidine kinase n=1 Tax=Pseudogulbenkiania ferrooxidans 2002 TaxID=279714 RepID=B9YZ57_9NEIS|nr:ATP-binding protein [Pseudogulbenkiania ferrooxidans]EEG10410.1 integral membrane sensor signal transduction histidine kinase [Pseudogulbenkiania ferrooxidans 2002]
MGRLFWKLFLILWLAQITTALGVGVAFSLRHQFESPRATELARQDPAQRPPPPPRHGPVPPEPLLVGLVASLIFGALLARYLSKPIRLMRGAFDAVAEGNLKVNLAQQLGRRQDELADLGRDFDLVAQRLQGLMDDKKRLLHDVSHELRSPLARLSAAVDLARQQPEKLDTWLERIEREAGRMDQLVGELLAIARLDAEGATGGETLSLRDFLVALVADAQFEAGLSGCRVELQIEHDGSIAARPDLLRRAVENVLRNAIRYSPPHSVVQIRVTPLPDCGQVRLAIHDHGPGVPEAELATIFEPFFRSSGSDNQGYGLGLAIAKRVIVASGGRIAAANAAEGGLMVNIELPLA